MRREFSSPVREQNRGFLFPRTRAKIFFLFASYYLLRHFTRMVPAFRIQFTRNSQVKQLTTMFSRPDVLRQR
jgi:hypothetical protein